MPYGALFVLNTGWIVHFSLEASRMRIASTSRSRFGLSVSRLVVLSAVLALAACEDPIAPEEPALTEQGPRLTQSASGDLLATLGTSLDDMTGWSLTALPDGNGKANVARILAGLKRHLSTGSVNACQQDVADARAVLASLSAVQQVETGHVGLALDVIKAALDGASK